MHVELTDDGPGVAVASGERGHVMATPRCPTRLCQHFYVSPIAMARLTNSLRQWDPCNVNTLGNEGSVLSIGLRFRGRFH